MSFWLSWRKVRGEFPGWCAGDAGMVPLSARETAKGGTQIPQTRFAQTVRYLRPNAVTRELRGTRSPDQGTPGRKLTAGSVENTASSLFAEVVIPAS